MQSRKDCQRSGGFQTSFCGSLHPLLLWESYWGFSPLQHRIWWSLGLREDPVTSCSFCLLCRWLSTAARALLPQGSCCHQPQGVTSDSWRLGCSTSFLWSLGCWSKLLLCQGWLFQPTWALPSLQFWVGTRVPTPTVACLSEILYVFMSEILCVFIPLKYVCCS